MPVIAPLRWRRLLTGAVLALCGCTTAPPHTAPGSFPRPTAGLGRIWIYRDYEPSETLARPYVQINGRTIAVSEPGGSFFRNLPPGRYAVTVDSFGYDVNQFTNVKLAAGETVFVKIESASLWESDLNYARDTFYTRVRPADAAPAELAKTRFLGGG